MRIGIILFLLVGLNLATAQTNFEKEIIGSWKLKTQVKSFKANAKSKTANQPVHVEVDPLISSDVLLRFEKNEKLAIDKQQFLLEVTYTLKNNMLTIGDRTFEILEIENDMLILKDISLSNDMRYEYKRIKTDE